MIGRESVARAARMQIVRSKGRPFAMNNPAARTSRPIGASTSHDSSKPREGPGLSPQGPGNAVPYTQKTPNSTATPATPSAAIWSRMARREGSDPGVFGLLTYATYATGLVRVPMPSIFTSTTSPAFILRVSPGVPV